MPSSSQTESSYEDSQGKESNHDSADESVSSSQQDTSSDSDGASQRDSDNNDEVDLSLPFQGSDNETSTGSNYTSEIERAENLLRSSSSRELPELGALGRVPRRSSAASERSPPSEQALRVNFTKRALEQYVQLWKDLQASTLDITHLPDEGYVGSSFWTAAEKQVFFASLARHGKHAVDRVCDDVKSKSVLEIRLYLHMLEYTSGEIVQDRIEAAHEISHPLESLLDQFADHIEANQLDQACTADREQFGHLWILDESVSGEIGEADLDTPGSLDKTVDSEQAEDMQPTKDESPLTSLDILRPSKLIELMQNIFMNARNPLEDNWQHLTILTIDSHGPSILRSAFEDLHLIVVNLVKKLVPAILMQATSRLRSVRDATVAHNVRAGDVAAALKILGLPQRFENTYWLSTINKRSINVYSRSERFKHDGAHSSRLGYKLTKRQLETCLLATDEIIDSDVGEEASSSERSRSASETGWTSSSEEDSLHEDLSSESAAQDVDQEPEAADLELSDELAEQEETQDAALAAKNENFLRHCLNLPHVEADILIKHEKRPKHDPLSHDERWPAVEGVYVAEWELSKRKKRRIIPARSRRSRQALVHFTSADSDTDMEESDSDPDEQDSPEELMTYDPIS